MANIKSAKKRILVIDKKTARNRRVKEHIKTVLRAFDAAMAEGDMEAAQQQLRLCEKKLMQAAAKGTIHKKADNTDSDVLQFVPFVIVSKTTGEAHIVVADKNGDATTIINHQASTLQNDETGQNVSSKSGVNMSGSNLPLAICCCGIGHLLRRQPLFDQGVPDYGHCTHQGGKRRLRPDIHYD